MIDLHSHILPQMDDGSKSAEESAKLLEILRTQGVTTVAATPHFYPSQEAPEDFLARRKESVARLPRELAQPLLIGAEVAYFPGIGSCDALIPLQLSDTGLLLVEMPFSPWTERIVADVCAIPAQLGLTPVLAHINRYRGSSQFPKFYRQLLENEVLFQCNAEAFEPGLRGHWALQQMKRGLVHFLGSDAHNTTSRPPKLDQAIRLIEKKLGKDFVAEFHQQAEEILGML